jgi:diguanylate cyclase (GGDEF)-like protein/PAS domain S-box-containing protein
LSFNTTIIALLCAAIAALSLLLVVPAYLATSEVLEHQQALSQQRQGALINQLIESHLQGIARSSASLAESPQLVQMARDRDIAAIKILLHKSINARSGDHIQAFVVQLKDGPLALVPGAALFNVYLPLAELASSRIVPDSWATLSTRQQQRDYQLLRLSLPIIAEPFGEVVGYLHAFVILNDNFWLLNSIQSVTRANAIALYHQAHRIGTIIDSQDQLPLFENPTDSSGASKVDSGVLRRQMLTIGPDSSYEVRLLMPDHTETQLQNAFFGTVGLGLLGALLIAALLLAALYRLMQRPVQQLIHLVDSIPDRRQPLAAGQSRELNRLATAVDSMVLRLQQHERRLSTILVNTPNLVFIKDRQLRYRMVNPPCAQSIGLDSDQITGLCDADIYPPDLAQTLARADRQVLAEAQQLQIEYSTQTCNLGQRDFLGTLFPMQDRAGEPDGIGGVMIDITEYKRHTGQQKLASQVFDCANEAILVLDHDHQIITANAAYQRISGYSFDQCCGQPLRALTDQPALVEQLRRDGRLQSETLLFPAEGDAIPIWLSISRVEDAANSNDRFIAMVSDISRMRSAERQPEYLSRYDHLTGLPNRQLFCDRLSQVMKKAAQQGNCVAVLFIDIDDFKSINESFGHAVGDQLLRETALRIERNLPSTETLARLGGDEFSIILDSIPDASSSYAVARALQQAFQTPFRLNNSDVLVTCTIGIALYPDDAIDAQTLLAKADTTAHHVKHQGRNGIHFFDHGVNIQAQQRLQLNDGLRRALSNGELFVEYQPRFDIHGHRVLGAEALLRWRHPEQGLISPVTFITLAEESGMILELGPWVLNRACLEAAEWNRQSPYPIPVSVNLSPRQLRDPELIPDICEALRQSGLAPELLELEITETVVIEDINRILGTLNELRDMGISLSIDDFGTGYSSLMYLKKLPVNTVKIDRSFVMDVPGNTDDECLIDAIITMAHSLRFKVVAEGVETQAQQAFLKARGCDELQGFLLARPDSCDALIRITRKSDANSDTPTEILLKS